jgi:hypothetical protein
LIDRFFSITNYLDVTTRLYFLAMLSSFSGFLYSCSCLGYSYSFSLADYDRAFDVVEVRFLEVMELGVSPSNYRRETATYDSIMVAFADRPESERLVPPPPPPPPPPRSEVLIRGVLLQAFKGKVKLDTLLFRTERDGAACGWVPRLGSKYLVYVGEPMLKDSIEAIWLSLCQRKTGVIWGANEYYAERSILESLNDCKDGIIAPIETIIGKEFVPFTGHFQDGKRVGLWTIFKPIFWWRDSFVQDAPIFNLKYSDGEIVRMKILYETLPGTSRRDRRWLRWAFLYLEEGERDE